MAKAKLALIAAVATNGVIGRAGALPWRLPSDFAFFKQTTMGKPIVMGRKTFESIGRPLPGRANLVVSGQTGFAAPGIEPFGGLDAALARAMAIAAETGVDEIFVIGGATLYEQALPIADRLYLTHVGLEVAGDVHFPPVADTEWRVVARPDIVPGPNDSAPFDVRVYERIAAPAH